MPADGEADGRAGEDGRRGASKRKVFLVTHGTFETYDRLRSIDLSHLTAAELERLAGLAEELGPAVALPPGLSPRRRIEAALRLFEVKAFGLDARHRPRFAALTQTFRGRERCVVVENPAAVPARLAGEITIASDGALAGIEASGFRPTFYLVSNPAFAAGNAARIRALRGVTKLAPVGLAGLIDEDAETLFYEPDAADNEPASDVVALARRLGFREVVAFAASGGTSAASQKTFRWGFPRLLVIDFTAAGDCSATGELKATLLGAWPASDIAQVFTEDRTLVLRRCGRDLRATEAALGPLVEAIAQFSPDVVLYRPAPGRLMLHRLLLAVLAERPLPVATWIMDDWLEGLATEDAQEFALHDEDLPLLFGLAPFGLAISGEMAGMLEARHSLPFRAIANGVDLDLFAKARAAAPRPVEDRLLVRYAGSLSDRMGLTSLVALARAVEELALEFDARFEIAAPAHWHAEAAPRFAGLPATRLVASDMARDDYVAWLAGADVVALAYNFDEASRAYAGRSLANKLPEALASGAVLLAIGPQDFSTMRAIEAAGCGVAIHEDGVETILAHLEALLDIGARRALAARQIAAAEAGYDALDRREALRRALVEIARSTVDAGAARALVRRSRLSPWRAPVPAEAAS